MVFIERARIVAPLPQMTGAMIRRVPIGREAAMGFLERQGKRGESARSSNDVYVVRHQTEANDLDAMKFRAQAEQFQVDAPLCIGLKDKASPVCPLRDVMRNSRSDYAR